MTYRFCVDISGETPAQRDRRLEAERINAAYAARRAAGLADNDAGMGRLAETETRDWRPGAHAIGGGVIGALKGAGVKL